VKKIAILGAGSCGTALAIALGRSRQPHNLSLWVHSADVFASLTQRRENTIYLPGQRIADDTEVTCDLAVALDCADIVLGVMPSAHARAIYTAALPHLFSQRASANAPPRQSSAKRELPIFVSATKGIESESLMRMSEVIAEVLTEHAIEQMGEHSPPGSMSDIDLRSIESRIAALSGPSFALEVARGDPTAVVVACQDAQVAAQIQEEFSGPTLRLYTNDDTVGVELGGAVKNVIAIAAGACAGLGLGANTIAALVTRGLAEMTRLAMALGGRRDTLAGLAGLGDLVLTATANLSRNRSVGVELGKGRPLAEILGGMRMVAEGVGTAAATLALGRKHGVEMPITEQMNAVLNQDRAPQDAIRELMERRLKQE
jgi:glycerol-3-phosphate dehydrogenase (NAD(P)+)